MHALDRRKDIKSRIIKINDRIVYVYAETSNTIRITQCFFYLILMEELKPGNTLMGQRQLLPSAWPQYFKIKYPVTWPSSF